MGELNSESQETNWKKIYPGFQDTSKNDFDGKFLQFQTTFPVFFTTGSFEDRDLNYS